MRVFPLLTAALLLAAFPLSAQNLLTNGDFEASGDIGFGEHSSFDMIGWETVRFAGSETSWNGSSLIQVDGPQGGDRGNLGPESDASAAPAGTATHYLTQTDQYPGSSSWNLIWQYFTPTCSGTVQGAVAFATGRDRPLVTRIGVIGPLTTVPTAPIRSVARIITLQESQQILALQNAIFQSNAYLYIPASPSRNFAWQTRQANSLSVIAGQTYAFGVALMTLGSIDNASVTYVLGDACLPPVIPTPEVTTAKTCAPIEVTQSGVIALTCQFTVTGTNLPAEGAITLTDGFAARAPALAAVQGSMSTISSADPWLCTDTGSVAGVTSAACQISAQALMDAGGTSIVDMSFDFTTDQAPAQVENCAVAQMSDAAPDTALFLSDTLPQSCVLIDVPAFVPSLPRLENGFVAKSCAAVRQGEVNGVTGALWDCNLTVVLNPAPFAGSFMVTEDASQITNGTASFVSASLPCTGLGTDQLQCEIDGATASSMMPLSVQLFAPATNPAEPIRWINCARGAGTGAAESIVTDNFCVETGIQLDVPTDTPTETVIDVTKTCEPLGPRQSFGPAAWFQPMRCALTVTTNGVPFDGPLWLTEELSYGASVMNSTISALSSTDPWQCSQAPYIAPGQSQGSVPYCVISGPQFPHAAGTSTVTVDFVLYGGAALQTGATNCVGVTLGDMPVVDMNDAQASDCVEIFAAPSEPEPAEPTGPFIPNDGISGHIADPFIPNPVGPIGPLITDGGTVGSVGGANSTLAVGEPQIHIAKTCDALVTMGTVRTAQCEITITTSNLPSGQYLGFTDTITTPIGSGLDPTAWAYPAPFAYGCQPIAIVPGGRRQTCGFPTDYFNMNGGTVTLRYHTTFPGEILTEDGVADAQNCVSLTLPSANLRSPADPNQQACATIEIREPRLDYSKTCAPLVFDAGAETAQAHCTITVTGSNLAPDASVQLLDYVSYAPGHENFVPFAGPFMNMAGAAGWQCSDYTNGWSSGVCATTGGVINAAGTMMLDWSAEIGPLVLGQPLQNCVAINVGNLSYGTAPRVCAPIEVVYPPQPATPTPSFLTAIPEHIGTCRADRDRQVYDCALGINIENLGDGAFDGQVAVLGTFGAPGIAGVRVISGDAVLCDGPVANAVTCVVPQAEWKPRDIRRFDLSLVVNGQRNGGQMQVCTTLGAPENERQRVAMVQTILNQRGLDAGPVDGLPGRRTYAALAQLQAQLGLLESREFDASLMQALGLAPTTEPSCTQLVLPPMPAPPLQCNAATTIARGDSCVCRYDDMARRNDTSCSCPRGTELVGGEGCRRVATPAPTPTPVPHDVPGTVPGTECTSGVTLNGACLQLGRPLIESLIPGLRVGE